MPNILEWIFISIVRECEIALDEEDFTIKEKNRQAD